MMLRNCRTAATAALYAFFCTSTALAVSVQEPDPIFGSDSVLEVTIRGPFTSIMEDRSSEEEAPGTLLFTDADGNIVEFDVGISLRGHFRRQKEICRFAPLRLNFRKSQTKNTLFDKEDKAKLVTHCQNGSHRYEQAVITEYLAYRILNLLTDASFRVRLLRVTYKDTDRADKERVSYAVLIEHRNRLAKRIDAPVSKIDKVSIVRLSPEHTNIGSIFQYLIGDTDFSPVAGRAGEDCCHNSALFGTEGQKLVSVPYDFDQSGFVNAPHANPNPRFHLSSVRTRLYRGRCFNNQHVPASLAHFQENRDEIDTLLREQPGLTSTTRKYLLDYVASFYKMIDNPNSVEKKLVKKCI